VLEQQLIVIHSQYDFSSRTNLSGVGIVYQSPDQFTDIISSFGIKCLYR